MANTINKRTKITLTATPKEGYKFISWSNGITDNPYTTTVGNIIGQENRIEPVYALEDSSVTPIGECASNEIKYISQSKIDINADADPRLYCKIVSDEYDNVTHYGCITFSEDVKYIPDTFFNNSYISCILKLSLPNTLKYIKMHNANIGILDIKNVNNNAIINVRTLPGSCMVNYIIHNVNEEVFVENGMFYTDNTKTDLIAVDNSVYEITIGGNSIQNIRRNCFKYFNSLTSVVINDCSIISNENNYGMFGSCAGIRTITINDINTSIHEYVLVDMPFPNVSIIMYYERPPFMPARVTGFSSTSAWVRGTIYVPDQYLSNYLGTRYWQDLNIRGLSTYQESQSGTGSGSGTEVDSGSGSGQTEQEISDELMEHVENNIETESEGGSIEYEYLND